MFEGLFAPTHLIIILVIVMIIFGPGKLPELGSGLAKGIKSFKDGMKELRKEVTAKPVDPKPIDHTEENAK